MFFHTSFDTRVFPRCHVYTVNIFVWCCFGALYIERERRLKMSCMGARNFVYRHIWVAKNFWNFWRNQIWIRKNCETKRAAGGFEIPMENIICAWLARNDKHEYQNFKKSKKSFLHFWSNLLHTSFEIWLKNFFFFS